MTDRVHAYANAVFEVASAEGRLDTTEEELFRFARTFEASDELRATLTDETIPIERRNGVVEELLGERVSPVTTNLVAFIVGSGRARQLPDIVDAFVERAASERAQAVAEVRSSTHLTDDQRARLAGALAHATGKEVSLKVTIDPSVLGGVVAQVGDTVIDGTIRHRLERLREAF